MAPKLYMIVLSPGVRAVQATAKALNIKLDEKELDFLKGELMAPDYLKLNPLHTVPTLDDNGNVITDSHAITAYLVGKYGKNDSLYPKDLYKKALVEQKLCFDLGMLFPLLKKIGLQYMKKEIKSLTPNLAEEIKDLYNFMETFLKNKEWIALDCVTIADFSCYVTTTCLCYHLPVDASSYPNVAAWMKRCQALPCFSNDEVGIKAFAGFFEHLKSS